MKNNIGLVVIVVTLLFLGLGMFLLNKNQPDPGNGISPESHLYFWGNGCPHCENVETFLNSWENKDNIDLRKFEVWYNTDNAKLMVEKVKPCELDKSEMGVPVLVTPDNNCFIGDTPIIDYFQTLSF
jgi:glutaredoxin